MPFDELSPVIQELSQNPVAFLGGFAAGLLRLNLEEDPVKTWLNKQGVAPSATPAVSSPSKSKGPQSISID
jgi:hypothetical protein